MFDAVFGVVEEVGQVSLIPATPFHLRREATDKPQATEPDFVGKQKRRDKAMIAFQQRQWMIFINSDQQDSGFGAFNLHSGTQNVDLSQQDAGLAIVELPADAFGHVQRLEIPIRKAPPLSAGEDIDPL